MEANESLTPQPLLSSNAQESLSPSEQPKSKTSKNPLLIIVVILFICLNPFTVGVVAIVKWIAQIERTPVATQERQVQVTTATYDRLAEEYPNQVNDFTITFNNVHKHWSGTGEQLAPDIVYVADAMWNQDPDISISISCTEPDYSKDAIMMNDCHLDDQGAFPELLRDKIGKEITKAATKQLSENNIPYSETSIFRDSVTISINAALAELATDSQLDLLISIATSAINKAETDQSKALAAANEFDLTTYNRPISFECKFIFSDKHTLAVTDEQKMHLDQYSVSSAQDMQAYLQSH